MKSFFGFPIKIGEKMIYHIICKMEFPLPTMWTISDIEDAEAAATFHQCAFLRIEGMDFGIDDGTDDDAFFEDLGFVHAGDALAGRKVWERKVLKKSHSLITSGFF